MIFRWEKRGNRHFTTAMAIGLGGPVLASPVSGFWQDFQAKGAKRKKPAKLIDFKLKTGRGIKEKNKGRTTGPAFSLMRSKTKYGNNKDIIHQALSPASHQFWVQRSAGICLSQTQKQFKKANKSERKLSIPFRYCHGYRAAIWEIGRALTLPNRICRIYTNCTECTSNRNSIIGRRDSISCYHQGGISVFPQNNPTIAWVFKNHICLSLGQLAAVLLLILQVQASTINPQISR